MPTKPAPFDWMTASMNTGYLTTTASSIRRKRRHLFGSPLSIDLLCPLCCIINPRPAQCPDPRPPFWVTLVARHNNLCDLDTFLRAQLFLHLGHPARNDRQRGKALVQRYIITVIAEVTMPYVDRYILSTVRPMKQPWT